MFSERDIEVIQAEFSILNKNYLIVMSKNAKGTVLQLVNLHDEGKVELEFNLDVMTKLAPIRTKKPIPKSCKLLLKHP